MRIGRFLLTGALLLAALAVNAGPARANLIYTVNLNTTAISGAAGYAVAFQLNDGSGLGDSNNTIVLSDFNFGGGSAGGCGVPGDCQTTGGASGDITSVSGVTLTDSDFFNSFAQRFTPGTSLSFRLNLTTNVDGGGTPDAFGFSLLLNGVPLPTVDPSGADTLLSFSIDSENPTLESFATTAESPVALDAPGFGPAPPAVPEPGSLLLMGSGLAGLLGLGRRRLMK